MTTIMPNVGEMVEAVVSQNVESAPEVPAHLIHMDQMDRVAAISVPCPGDRVTLSTDVPHFGWLFVGPRARDAVRLGREQFVERISAQRICLTERTDKSLGIVAIPSGSHVCSSCGTAHELSPRQFAIARKKGGPDCGSCRKSGVAVKLVWTAQPAQVSAASKAVDLLWKTFKGERAASEGTSMSLLPRCWAVYSKSAAPAVWQHKPEDVRAREIARRQEMQGNCIIPWPMAVKSGCKPVATVWEAPIDAGIPGGAFGFISRSLLDGTDDANDLGISIRLTHQPPQQRRRAADYVV